MCGVIDTHAIVDKAVGVVIPFRRGKTADRKLTNEQWKLLSDIINRPVRVRVQLNRAAIQALKKLELVTIVDLPTVGPVQSHIAYPKYWAVTNKGYELYLREVNARSEG